MTAMTPTRSDNAKVDYGAAVYDANADDSEGEDVRTGYAQLVLRPSTNKCLAEERSGKLINNATGAKG